MSTALAENRQIQIKEIVKRDGRHAVFNKIKIADAVRKAFDACGEYKSENYCLDIADSVLQAAVERIHTDPTVEQIQDLVEEELINRHHYKVAKAFIIYRAERNRVREKNTRLMKIYQDITFSEAKDSDLKRENANVNGDTAMGTMLKYGSVSAKEIGRAHV